MAIYRMSGDIRNITTTPALTGGSVVVVQDIIQVVISDIPALGTGAAYVKGIFEFATAISINDGDSVYFNVSGNTITKTDTDVYAGRAIGANTGTKVLVNINWMPEVVGS